MEGDESRVAAVFRCDGGSRPSERRLEARRGGEPRSGAKHLLQNNIFQYIFVIGCTRHVSGFCLVYTEE